MNPEKPKAVLHAERALWAWTAWSTLFGVYQLFAPWSAETQRVVAQFEELTGVTVMQLRMAVLGIYLLAALSMVWVILRLGDGKNWARITLVVTFVLEVLWMAITLGNQLSDLLVNLPDFGLQIYALYMVYTEPGRGWFKRAKA